MKKWLWVGALVGVLMVAALALPVLAHEGREVAEEYLVVFGWREEPAYTTLFNGPEFSVKLHSDESAVVGLEETLKLEVSYGGKTKTLRLRAVNDEQGNYTADMIPTQPGDYSFRLTGTINGIEIDETFSSAEGEFSSVEPISDIQFP
jgi:hypothetical protein